MDGYQRTVLSGSPNPTGGLQVGLLLMMGLTQYKGPAGTSTTWCFTESVFPVSFFLDKYYLTGTVNSQGSRPARRVKWIKALVTHRLPDNLSEVKHLELTKR